ncbi:MAG: terminase small subunit [Rhodospirillales bacterium]|nr:terminase small subunit [Rhodospirillales bacterium]
MTLTPKQQRFIDEYLTDLNATQAAIRAGYSKKTAAQVGFEGVVTLVDEGARIDL